VIAGNYVDVKTGNVMPLGNMPIAHHHHNVELRSARAFSRRFAGTYAQNSSRED